MVSSASSHQCCGCIEQNYIASGRFLSAENFVNDGSVAGGVTARDILDRGVLHSELFRRDLISAHTSLAHLGNASRSGDGDLIEAVQSMHHQGPVQSQHTERFGELFYQLNGIQADYLCGRARRLGERAEQIENRAQAKLTAGRLDV